MLRWYRVLPRNDVCGSLPVVLSIVMCCVVLDSSFVLACIPVLGREKDMPMMCASA